MDDGPMLNATVAQLRVDLETMQREAYKLEHQLTCLIQLVRRAWTGDKEAASDVAKIVGVAPPVYAVERNRDMVAINAKPRPRVLHNWVSLTVGLLNLDYKRSQHAAMEQQQSYLAQRNNFLNDQIVRHDTMMNNGHDGLIPPNSSCGRASDGDLEKKVPTSRPPTGKMRVKHLYRSPQHQPEPRDQDRLLREYRDERRSEPTLTWGDLFIKGYQRNDNEQESLLNRRPTSVQFADDEQVMTYNHPERYSKLDLFEMVLANDSVNKRPLVRSNSMDRARPKSSVQRASSAARGRPAPQRPRTAHVNRQNQNTPTFNNDFTVLPVRDPSPELVIKRPPPKVKHVGRTLGEQMRKDTEKENYYEREFRKTASQLQKKLGITFDGMV